MLVWKHPMPRIAMHITLPYAGDFIAATTEELQQVSFFLGIPFTFFRATPT